MNKLVSMIGLGYIGLPTAVLLASRGINVVGVDTNKDRLRQINDGSLITNEPELQKLLKSVLHNQSLSVSNRYTSADVFIVAVPTPANSHQGNIVPDLTYVLSAIESIAPNLRKGNLIIIESTCPVGTVDYIIELLSRLRVDLSFPDDESNNSDVKIAYCPERIMPGNALAELVQNARIIGGKSPACGQAAKMLYQNFVEGTCRVTNAKTAELAKLTENAYRDVQIAFANEMSIICDSANIDVFNLRKLINLHPRVDMLEPGPGVGGHCIAVDPYFLIDSFKKHTQLISTARSVNKGKEEWVYAKIIDAVKKVKSIFDHDPAYQPKIAFYGITYKSNIDDIRESAALRILQKCDKNLDTINIIIEPNLPQTFCIDSHEFKITRIENLKNSDVDVHVMLVDHTEFHSTVQPDGIVIDLRGVWCDE